MPRPLRVSDNTIRGLDTNFRYPENFKSDQIARIKITSSKKNKDDKTNESDLYSDFLITSISTGSKEKFQVFNTFSKPTAFFYGTHPQYINATGVLVNSPFDERHEGTFDDEEILRRPWSTRFIHDYFHQLAGTVSLDKETIMEFQFYEWIYKGRLVNFNWAYNSVNIESVNFSFDMYVTDRFPSFVGQKGDQSQKKNISKLDEESRSITGAGTGADTGQPLTEIEQTALEETGTSVPLPSEQLKIEGGFELTNKVFIKENQASAGFAPILSVNAEPNDVEEPVSAVELNFRRPSLTGFGF